VSRPSSSAGELASLLAAALDEAKRCGKLPSEPPLDFMPKIEQNPELQTFLFDPLGAQGWLRPNRLHPPFNNKKARQALFHMMDEETYLRTVRVLPHLPFGICLWQPLRDEGRC
jgi:ABC-type transport system substrate-binding protein